MSKELTDKWKLGELKNGLYYFGNNDKSEIAYLDNSKRSIYTMDNNIPKCLKENTEVLAPVHSYTEYLESESHCEENKRLKQDLEDARKYQAIQNDDIARLKQLLKQWLSIYPNIQYTTSLAETNKVLELMEQTSQMLQNHENVAENVANTESQHC